MKTWQCASCRTETLVDDDYKPEYCCSGRECGCYGMPVNPVFCDDCEEKYFPGSKERDQQCQP